VRERTGHVIQEPIFVPKHYSGSNDGRIDERLFDGNFTFGLVPVELRGRVQRRVQMRDVNKFRNPTLLGDVGNRFGTSDMHGTEIEVPKDLGSAFGTKG